MPPARVRIARLSSPPMKTPEFGYDFISGLARHCLDALPFTELTGADGGPLMQLTSVGDSPAEAGFVRLWSGENLVDRMVHVRLQGTPVDTQLFFLFGNPAGVMPHFHGQVVQFAPDACVYNADLIPRLDPVDHPGYYELVMGPLTTPYWKATQKRENACASAPGNPAIAAYLSPWSIGAGRPTDRAELERVGPQVQAYLDHYLALARQLDYAPPDPELMRDRDRRHMGCFFDERLDPRAWKGVYRLVGDVAGQEIRRILTSTIN